MARVAHLDDLLLAAARTAADDVAGDGADADLPGGVAAAEQMDPLYEAWAATPHPDLGTRTPREYVATLTVEQLVTITAKGAEARGGQPPRLLAAEWLSRLDREQQAATRAGKDPAGTRALAAIGTLAMAEPEKLGDSDAGCLAAVNIMQRWAQPVVIPWLMAVLATEHPRLRTAAAAALGQVGLPALGRLQQALQETTDPLLRRGLLDALTNLPQHPDVDSALTTLWSGADASDRLTLTAGIGRRGDPSLLPLLRADAAIALPSRLSWATDRVALQRLGDPSMPTPPPPPNPAQPELDLLAGCHTLLEGKLQVQAREWLQEGLLMFEQQAEEQPDVVDWYLHEQFQALADQLWNRGAAAPLRRFAEYATGALFYHGALRLPELLALISLSTAIPEPDADALWAALGRDPRLSLRAEQVVALAEVEDVEVLLERRRESGLPPALVPISAMALAARDLMQHAWTAVEAEAAHKLMHMLPPELASPQQIVALQKAIRGAQGNDESMEAFRDWLRDALKQGLEPTQELKDALAELWDHTARWELFGHTPWSAREISEMTAAQGQAGIAPDDPCPCGSGKAFTECCGKH